MLEFPHCGKTHIFCNIDLFCEKIKSYSNFSPYASIGYASSAGGLESNSNSLTRKGRFNITTATTPDQGLTSNSNSLTKKGRFRVKRVRTGSCDEGRPDSKEQSPNISIVAASNLPKNATISMPSPK